MVLRHAPRSGAQAPDAADADRFPARGSRLTRACIAPEFYHPTSLDDLKRRIRPETRLIWTETPGSSTLEVQDLAGIVAIAREAGALTGRDNTWATARVERILWPVPPDDPGHAIWRRDFTGAAGVFGVLLAEGAPARLDAAFDRLEVIAIGASWVGTRSLIAPMSIKEHRTIVPWQREDLILRISVGLEDFEDLDADIDRFFAALG